MTSPNGNLNELFSALKFNESGLIPAVAQQHDTGEVLMLAWMNREALLETLKAGQVHYWSRSRNALWRKGETSGQTQKLIDLTVDCDGDTLLLKVDQKGPACHTGRRACFFRSWKNAALQENQPVLIPTEKLYE